MFTNVHALLLATNNLPWSQILIFCFHPKQKFKLVFSYVGLLCHLGYIHAAFIPIKKSF